MFHGKQQRLERLEAGQREASLWLATADLDAVAQSEMPTEDTHTMVFRRSASCRAIASATSDRRGPLDALPISLAASVCKGPDIAAHVPVQILPAPGRVYANCVGVRQIPY